jgi:hypothetical protein
MSCARRTRRRSPAAGASRQWHVDLALCGCLLAGLLGKNPAAAQVPEGGPQNPSGSGGEAGPPTGGGGPAVAPAIPGPAPATLPPPPGGGFGTPNPVAPPYSVNNEAPTLLSPPTLRLLPPQAGVVPLQAYDPTAPAVLIQPFASVGETFTDNVNYTHSPRNFAAITTLSPGLSVSADTPRLQAVAAGSASGTIYLPSSNSSLNQVYGNLYANGHATIYPDLLFVDFQNAITQSTTLPGFGFQNLSTLPRNQQTQQYVNNVSPYIVKSFDGWVDTQLRYFFSASNYGGATAIATLPSATLTSSTLNEGTFIAATGENFQQFLARFTANASTYTAAPTAQNTQVSAFNDFEYRFTPGIAGLARLGYQNQHYPGSPAANFAGATWLAGGQLGTLGPDQPAYVILEYGRQQGVYRHYRRGAGQPYADLAADRKRGAGHLRARAAICRQLGDIDAQPFRRGCQSNYRAANGLLPPGCWPVEQRLSPARLSGRFERGNTAERLFAVFVLQSTAIADTADHRLYE